LIPLPVVSAAFSCIFSIRKRRKARALALKRQPPQQRYDNSELDAITGLASIHPKTSELAGTPQSELPDLPSTRIELPADNPPSELPDVQRVRVELSAEKLEVSQRKLDVDIIYEV
jgi:hypothetical protein